MTSTDQAILDALDFEHIEPCGLAQHRDPTPANYYVRRGCRYCHTATAAFMCHACWLGIRRMSSVCTVCGTWARFETTVIQRIQIKELLS